MKGFPVIFCPCTDGIIVCRIGVDTCNYFYSLLFEPNHDWPEYFLKRNELWAYMEGVADKFDNRRHIRFKAEAKSVIYNESSSDWDIQICSADSTTESLIEKDAIVTKDGTRHEADPIVLATGFLARKMLWPMHVHGRDGQAIRDLWGDDNPRARLGIAVPGFPNMFMLYGPGTNLAHGGSAIYHTECQVRYIMQCLRELLETGAKTMECRREPHDAFNRLLDETHANMVWAHRGVGNWYKNKDGRVVTNSPFRLVDYRRMTEQLDRNDYIMA